MSSEEQQIASEEATSEASEVKAMDIDTALLLYKNLQYSLTNELDQLISPFVYNQKGQRTKSKNQGKRMNDLMILSTVLKASLRDIESNPDQFQTEKAKNLYGSLMAVNKAKEVIKADLKAKLLGDDGPDNVSSELKDKLIKEL